MKYFLHEVLGYRYIQCWVRNNGQRKQKTVEALGKDISTFEAKKRLKEWNSLFDGKFDIIYADPPWPYDFSKSDSRAIESHYPTMKLEEICALKIPAGEDAVLFLWVPAPKIVEGLEVLKAWGFEYKTNLVWVKDKIGMGYHARGRHELLFIGTKGKGRLPAVTEKWESVIFAPRTEHSKKPEIVYSIIEAAYPESKYLELFARSKHEGWTSWGNEV